MKNKGQAKKGTMKRLIRMLFEFYPVLLPLVLVCIVLNALISSIPAIFQQNIIAVVEQYWQTKDWAAAAPTVTRLVLILVVLYALSLAAGYAYSYGMAIITQGSLKKMREKMFNRMQDLPIKYFDTHNHGDIMSYYTNDIDTLRQLISQSIPQLMISCITVVTIFSIMLYYSMWLLLVVLCGVALMFVVTKKVGSSSAHFFLKQQIAVGKTEGFVEEIMNGQKVVKVFSHETETKKDFDRVNDELFEMSCQANRYANMLMPILMNMGNILYVVVALAGGMLLLSGTPNLSLSGMALSISITVPFLNMTRQFCGNIGQVSNQVNSVVMGLAGADRIFSLLDEEPETDDGYVTLVNAKEENGELVECSERTDIWAWKHPHSADGSVTYTRLTGDVRLKDVDFGYNPDKIVLHDVSLYAEPGQKVAFVGATGAGKTTMVKLLMRFYDVNSGRICLDGHDIRNFNRGQLREMFGMVLQDTWLFQGTIMENIRYGRLDATDEEVIAAAKAAHADHFIRTLPGGYQMELNEDATNVSQGQKQLLTIARAILADNPILILDEATSSVDTRTEIQIQKAMNNLMKGRTSFVIAHRLSTIRDADVILVMKNGDIAEQGTHEELLAKGGFYAQLYNSQFEKTA